MMEDGWKVKWDERQEGKVKWDEGQEGKVKWDRRDRRGR